ncbi:MAG: thioredoxin family protein [Bacteroidales bacterium]|nr:thioredoxin family protein [Bacteroidales bacterium]
MYVDLKNLEEFNSSNKENIATLIYFSHEKCNVCKVLKPKVEELTKEKFPKIKLLYADTVKYPEIAAQNQIFAVPTILVFFDGRESIRKSRNIGLKELEDLLKRPYGLIFD